MVGGTDLVEHVDQGMKERRRPEKVPGPGRRETVMLLQSSQLTLRTIKLRRHQ